MRISVNARQLNTLARKAEKLGNDIDRAQYRSVNKVAEKAFADGRRRILSQVNLTASYLKKDGRYTLQKATSSRPYATITARGRATRLATYGAKQLLRKAPKRKKNDKRWGVQAGSGDSLRNIPQGSVSGGISVKVKKSGSRKRMRGAFFMPLRSGNVAGGNAMGAFVRVGEGKKAIKHLYGPSVDQVFRGVIPEIEPKVRRDLKDAFVKQVRYELQKGKK